MKKPYFVRTIILAGTLLLQLTTFSLRSHGAAGDVDLSFDPGSGVDGPVNAFVVQPDGKVIIAGYFGTVKGFKRSGIARLHADGSGDSSFDAGNGVWGISSILLQPDGKILVGNYLGIQRRNSDGSLDDTFSATMTQVDGYESVNAIAIQPDGKVLIGGYFTIINDTERVGIARLNADGTLDSSFNPGAYGVIRIAVQPDGKVLIGGVFQSVNGTNRNRIARLNADGSLDSSFDPGTGPNNWIYTMTLQPDGKVLVGGPFTTVNSTNRNRIARLNADGSLDGSFNPGTLLQTIDDWWEYLRINSLAVQADGKVVVGGAFTVNGTNWNNVARFNADGTLDGHFNLGTGADYTTVHSVAVQPDGKVLIGGEFNAVHGTIRNHMARLDADGSLDDSFNPGEAIGGGVASVLAQPDGQVLIGGSFVTVNGTNRSGIARLNADGRLDSSFNGGKLDSRYNPVTFAYGGVLTTALQEDGQVLIGGAFTTVNGTNFNDVARLNANGSLDTSFQPDVAALNPGNDCPGPYCETYPEFRILLVQPDGKVIIAGRIITAYPEFDGYQYFYRYFFGRFNANGSRDNSFIPDTGIYQSVSCLVRQPDGKLLVGGGLFLNGTLHNVFRLNADGSLDSSFTPVAGFFGVSSIALQPDGKVLIGGEFTTVNGTNRNYIARLDANGSLDNSFNPGTGPNNWIASLALQPDGKVLIGGDFTTFNGTNRNRIARLNADGSLDGSFNPGAGADGRVRSIALQSDGNVLIGGDFTTVNGVLRPRVARLFGDSAVPSPSLNIARSNAFVIVSWPASQTGFVLQQNTNLNPTHWTTPSETIADNGTTRSITVNPSPGNRFFRLFKP